MNAPLIEAHDVSVSLSGKVVLSHTDIHVAAGEIVTLVGPNGAGKTSLVRVLLDLLKPDSGTVTRRKDVSIGYMPQRLHVERTMPMTVGRFLQLGLPRHMNGKGRRHNALAEVGAGGLMNNALQDISGGEMQRVMLARALLREPALLVLDEPVQGVDVVGQAEFYKLIRGLRERRGVGVLMVSHDLHVVMAETDRVVCLNQHVCCEGHPESVSRHPEFVQLFGANVASTLAVYSHHHDHEHDMHGNVVHPHSHENNEGHSHDG